MSFNEYFRVDTSDYRSIVADALANGALARTRMDFVGSGRFVVDDDEGTRHSDVETETETETLGHPTDRDSDAWEAWCLGVAAGEIVESLTPAPADPDDDLDDDEEQESGEVLRELEVA